MTQGKSRMRQFRMSGSVRGVAREGDSYRDMFKVARVTRKTFQPFSHFASEVFFVARRK
jgi:hypothetical protein